MSRAMLVDPTPDDDQENLDQIEQPEAFEAQSEETETVEQPEANIPDDDIPEKYRGKSLKEVVQMHQEAEKLMSRHSSEVGELRRVVDDYISSQKPVAPQKTETVETEDELDYFTNPQAAVYRAIENHPKIKEAEQYTADYKKQAALAELQNRHPDMQSILQDEKFAEWIKASKIRTQLFVEADQQYNAEAANELFDLWKERKAVAEQTVSVEKKARKQALKEASTGSAKGSAEGQSRKVYRRADIIRLMQEDPKRYAAMSDEIFKAYAEGRVK